MKKYLKFLWILPLFLLFFLPTSPTLQVIDRTTGLVVASYPLNAQGEFSVSFIHSVNLSPVEDFYRVEKGQFVAYQTLYYHFGAGVQTDLADGQSLTVLPDGGMLIEGLDTVISPLLYNISPVYDHILIIEQTEYPLSELGVRAIAFVLE
ncbi:MAG: DUF1850 domain-containing protein [Eubacteriales bacterium]